MKRKLLSVLVAGLVAGSIGVAQGQEKAVVGLDKAFAMPSSGPTSEGPGVTTAQVARLQEKLRLIDGVMRASSADIRARPNAAEAAKWARESLYGMSLEQVSAVGTPTTFEALSDSIAKNRVLPKALGAASSDLVFFPFAPCRYIDTRNAGGKIAGARGFDFANAGGTYGGDAACNLTTLSGAGEDQIAAVSLNMTIVDTSAAGAPGFATARPAGATQQTALVNWTVASSGFQLGNAAVITTNQSGAANELEIFTSGAVHAIVDVAGVFAAPTATALSCTQVNSGDVIVPPNSAIFVEATCPAGYTLTGGGFYINEGSLGVPNDWLWVSYPFGNTWRTAYSNQTGGNRNGRTYAVCCRIPGR